MSIARASGIDFVTPLSTYLALATRTIISMNSYRQRALSGLLVLSIFSCYIFAAIKALSIADDGQPLSSGILSLSAQAEKSNHPRQG